MSSSLIPKKQRALILQGGGALGAYEAGVFEAICKKISEEDPKWEGNLFDILAGASIGAINVTFLASYFLKNGKSWAGSDTALATFWEGFKNNTLVDNENPFFRWWFDNYWNYLNKADPVIAPAEAARRYWSWTELANIPWLG